MIAIIDITKAKTEIAVVIKYFLSSQIDGFFNLGFEYRYASPLGEILQV